MVKPKTIYFPEDANRSGIDITYIKSRKELIIGGWYDTCVGIESTTIKLEEFLKRLGIDIKVK